MKISIPNKIRHLKFCRVVAGGKDAIDKDLYTRPLTYEQILPWIEAGGNYGVICGPITGVGAIDADHMEYVLAVENYLLQTFSVRSSTERKRHFYLIIKNFPVEKTNKISLVDPDDPDDPKKQGGDIRYGNFYLVGPGSIHPDTGKPYTVIDDVPIAEIEFGEIDALLSPYYKTSIVAAPGGIARGDYPLPIGCVLEYYKVAMGKVGKNGEMSGAHPVHGSQNGTNFGINIEKNVWCCRRCNSGGSVIHLVALLERLVDCVDIDGNLPDDIYDRVIAIIKEKFGVDLFFETRGPLNDTYNANIFTHMHKGYLRYCGPLGGWLFYNGKIWERDNTNFVKSLANQTYTQMLQNTPSWVPVITERD